ncbi:MAG: hypothetical protein AVO39_03035 [delta proteobacterium MLS_D]|jgi:hypothetical protein|nr:MAG: hypothetical protein AVO39_03035 [delta proteobacterium MLS_D]
MTSVLRRTFFMFLAGLFLLPVPCHGGDSFEFRAETKRGPVLLQSFCRCPVEGEAVMLRLEAPPFKTAGAVFNGRNHSFTATGEGKYYFTLIPIELDTPPGNHEIRLEIVFPDDSRLDAPVSLAVLEGTFPSSKISVESCFTDPSPDELRRIEEERTLVTGIYRNRRSEWLGNGSFIRPLDGAVTSPFGVRRLFNGEIRSRHRGVDLRAPERTPVQAVNSGVVVLARSLFFAGGTVIIDHGADLFTLYCHLSEIAVNEGDHVGKGTVIGRVGATGRVTGPHLHWGTRLASVFVDPTSILHLPFD